MKPIRLDLQGFTAFHNRVTVEFEGRQLFAITGPTGAGKSSLLDAMIWALFGRVPRVGNQIGALISHGALLARVRLEFEARGQRYIVARVRPVKGATTARLERVHAGADPEPLADSVNEVNAYIEAILGIDYETFVKTIILPQGDFAAFLSGDPKAKKEVLTSLLGLEVFKGMMQAANNRASGAKIAADALQQQYDHIEFRDPATLVTLEAVATDAEVRRQAIAAKQLELKRLEACAAEFAARATEAHAAAVAAQQTAAAAAQAARAAEDASLALAAAGAARAALANEVVTLAYDPAAHKLLGQQLTAAEQLEAARAHLATAERASHDARAAEERAVAAADQQRRAATEALAALEGAGKALAGAAAPAQAAALSLEAAAADADAARGVAEQKSHEFELKAKQLQHLAGTATALRHEVEAADSTMQRATSNAAVAEASRVRAEAAEIIAATDLEAAQRAFEHARTQDAAAAILATLAIGDNCPVCGEPITVLQPHAAPDLAAAEQAHEAARHSNAGAVTALQRTSMEAAAAHAHADAARTAFENLEARRSALDEALTAAAVTTETVDRSAKRAATAAAAEHDRALEVQRTAEAATEAARCLRVLLVKVPVDLVPAPPKRLPAPVPADAAALAAILATALEAHATAANGAEAARSAVAQAEAHIATAAAEVKTALAVQAREATAVDAADSALIALGAAVGTSLAALHADLEAMDALAARASTLAAELAQAEQQGAAASAVVEERRAASEAAARAVVAAEASAAAAASVAEDARASFEVEWRRQLPPSLEPDVTAVPELLDEAARRANQLATEVGLAQATLAAARADVDLAAKLLESATGYRQNSEVASDLGKELQANHFVAFIQQEAMQILAADAGARMLQLSRERYRIEADGDEFVVVDRLNGDERRSVRTLSGGETFLASLALALALSERLPELSGRGGALSLESLFLDEGFGSLDAESLDVAIQGLELLATGNRMIGVISHIGEVAERLPDRIEVVKTGGTSTIR